MERLAQVDFKANILLCCRLETLKEEEWNGDVIVVSCDMREWDAPEKVGFRVVVARDLMVVKSFREFIFLIYPQADILVSELLGSFGDNELSPECLDGAQSFLKG